MECGMDASRRIRPANPPGRPASAGHSERRPEGHSPRKVRNVTLPRKTAKEFPWYPYLKPTQVDKVNIQRRLREHSLRN